MADNKQQLPIEVEGNKEGSTNASVNKEEVAKQQGDSCIDSQDVLVSRKEGDKPPPSLSSTTTIVTASTSTDATKNMKVGTTNDLSDQVTSRDASDAALKHDEFASKDENQSQPSAKNGRLDSDDKKMDDTPIGNNSKPDSNILSAASVPQTTKGGTAVVTASTNPAVVTTVHTAADVASENHTKVGSDGGDGNSIANETVVKPTAAQPELTSSRSNLPPNKQSSSGVVQVPVSTKKVEPPAIFATLSQMDQVPNNILKLLQTYGPLTATEITYNIPPTELSIPSILEVMRVLNVIHYHEDGGYYYFHNGEIRADTIYPSEIIDIVQDTQDEIKETMERIQLLKEELQQNVHIQNRARSAREFLKNLVGKYGGERGIRSDPVYATALKTLNVDLGIKRKVAEVESVKRKKITRKKKKEEGTSAGSTNKTVVGDGSVVECGDNEVVNKSSVGLKIGPVAAVMKDSERKHEDGVVQASKVMAVEQPPLQPGVQQPQPQQSLAKQPGQPQKQQKPSQPGQIQQPLAKQPGQPQPQPQQRQPSQPGHPHPQPQLQSLAKQPGQPQPQQQPLPKQAGQPQSQQRQPLQPGQPQPQQRPLAKQPGQSQQQRPLAKQPGQPQQQRPLAKQPGQPQQSLAKQPGQPQKQQKPSQPGQIQQPLAKQPGQPQQQRPLAKQPGQPQQPLAKQPGQPQQKRQPPQQPQPQQQPLAKQAGPPQQQRQPSQPGQPQQQRQPSQPGQPQQPLAKQPGQPQQQRQPSQPGQPQQQPLAKQAGPPQQQRQSSQPGQPQPQQQPLAKQPGQPQQQLQAKQPGQPQRPMVKQPLAKQPGQPHQQQ